MYILCPKYPKYMHQENKGAMALSKTKAFWISFIGTLLVIIPMYLFAMAYSVTKTVPTDVAQSNIPMVQPVSTDTKTLLVMIGPQEPEAFLLIRFDAVKNQVCVAAVPQTAQVFCGGEAVTLWEAVQQAGPAQAAAALRETLEIPVDHYLFCTGEKMASMCGEFSNIQLPLEDYLSQEMLGKLQLSVPGVSDISITPSILCGALREQSTSITLQNALRAQGYLSFLEENIDNLSVMIPDAMRTAVSSTSTNLTATDFYSYERILKFLQKQTPIFQVVLLPGNYQKGVYYFSDETKTIAENYLGRQPQQ